jgi:2-oxoisovalerate dehydrogenase E1 component alpha subunit
MTDDVVQLLTPEGDRIDHPDYPLPADHELLRTLYLDMILTRRTDVESTALQRTGELGLWCPVLGQEGAQVGAGHAMRPTDYGFTSYRELGIFMVRDVDPVELLHVYRGVTHSSWDPRRVGLGIFTIVIGSHALHAVGYAMGIQRDGSDEAVLACFGDGASSTGDVHEAMVFAASFATPVVFFVQNNQWAISVPASRQARAPLAHRAAGYGIPSVRIDGNDVLASFAVTQAALNRAREGGGPTFIEAVTYRRGPHTTSDDPTRYRDDAELHHWASLDPIDRLQLHMQRVGAWDDEFARKVEQDADALAEHLREAIRGMTDPDPMTMFDDVYAEPHPQVEVDRRRMAAFLAAEDLPTVEAR